MLLIATNERIQFDVTDKAFTDRLVPIEFTRRRKIDRGLDAKLATERAGILNWVLAGVDSYMRDELQEPESIRAARATAETEVSTALQFIEAALSRGKVRAVPSSYPVIHCCKITPLHALYKSWAKATGVGRPLAQQAFTRVVSQRYPLTADLAGDGVKHYTGITMRKRRV
jgi:phage/plasmid-associated DNA primase